MLSPLILLIGTSARTRGALTSAFAGVGFRTIHEDAGTFQPPSLAGVDVVLLDIGAPLDPIRIVTRLRRSTVAPVLVVSPLVREEEKIAILDAGANDFVVKPVGTGELLARVRVWLRQSAMGSTLPPREASSEARLRINHEGRSLLIEGHEVHLTPLEYRLLDALASSPGALVQEADLITALWGAGAPKNALKLYIRRLRQKIERDPSDPRCLIAEDGGFRLRIEE